jgi:flagellar hook assembly protein FlgD
VRYRAHQTGHVRVHVLDPRGRRVRALFEGIVGEGAQAVRWDGRDDAGRPVASGVYLASITMGQHRTVGPMVLVR